MAEGAGPLLIPATTAFIREAARAGRFVSYGQVADAQGAEWARVRQAMGRHLLNVCAAAMAEGGPMISAIVVNRTHLATGDMDEGTLAGFLASARELGLAVEDGRAFLRAQQRATFAWGRGEAG